MEYIKSIERSRTSAHKGYPVPKKMAKSKTYLINNGYLQRLNDAYNRSGLMPTELARMIGKERKVIYCYLYGDTTPDALTLARLCIALNISADWLLFGKDDCNR